MWAHCLVNITCNRLGSYYLKSFSTHFRIFWKFYRVWLIESANFLQLVGGFFICMWIYWVIQMRMFMMWPLSLAYGKESCLDTSEHYMSSSEGPRAMTYLGGGGIWVKKGQHFMSGHLVAEWVSMITDQWILIMLQKEAPLATPPCVFVSLCVDLPERQVACVVSWDQSPVGFFWASFQIDYLQGRGYTVLLIMRQADWRMDGKTGGGMKRYLQRRHRWEQHHWLSSSGHDWCSGPVSF